MKKVMAGLSVLALVGCTPDYQEKMADDRKPRVISATPVSVTISQYGNSLINRAPLAETIDLAQKTCKGLGKQSAVYSSVTDPDKSSAFDPEYMRNHQFFLCQ